MRKLIPHFILEKFLKGRFSGSMRSATMFLDISGFTAMTHRLMQNGKEGAEILSDIINRIYTPSIETIYRHNGFIATFAGDAFTAVFPYSSAKPQHAAQAALEIRDVFSQIGTQSTKFGKFRLRMKIGLSYGKIDWGIITNDAQNSYYFRGEAIDACARSEHNAASGEIVLDETIVRKLQDKVETKRLKGGFYLLRSCVKLACIVRNEVKSCEQTLQKFVPLSISSLKNKGEFRDIISCFISFKVKGRWKQSVSKIIELSNDYGGYFNKIDFGDKGGNILVLFGAPVGREKLYERACDFALAVSKLHNLPSRIGLTYGTVFAGFIGSELRSEYTALGMVVNLSARYMMKANWQDVYIDRYINGQLKKIYEIDKLAPQIFKGFSEPIPVFLLKRKIGYSKFYEGKLIGRQRELQKLQRTLKPLGSGKFAGIVYVHGIAGIGKSRLVAELKNSIIKNEVAVAMEKLQWFFLPCDEILRKSFNPFLHFLRNYFEQSPENSPEQNRMNFVHRFEIIVTQIADKEIREELIRTKSILGAQLNLFWADSLYEQLDAKGRYENTLFAFKNLIKAESLDKPIILELEDGHWIDPDSQKLLEVLTRNVENFPFMIISACRFNDDGSKFNFGLQEIPHEDIILNYLNRINANNLVNTKLQGEASKELLDLIWQKSEGNPFYIEQIILYLQDKKLIDDKLELIETDFEMPKSINAIIIARIDRLTSELKELVQTASVLGKEFAVNILAAMLNKKKIEQELTKGERENIWNALSDLNYIFKHALIHETVYEMQLKKRLRKLHKLAAVTIEKLYSSDLAKVYPELADHYDRAQIKAKAIEYLQKAGDLAKQEYKNEQAIEFYNRLLEYPIEKISNVKVLLSKANILEWIGNWSESEEIFKNALKMAEELENKKLIATSCGNLGWQKYLKSKYQEAMQYFEKQLSLSKEIDDDKGISTAKGNIGSVYYAKGNYPEAMKNFKEKLNYCRELKAKDDMVAILSNIGLIYKNTGDHKKAREYFQKQLATAQEINDKNGISVAFGNLGILNYSQGKLKRAMDYFRKKIKIKQELGDKRGILTTMNNIGVLHNVQGNLDEALDCFQTNLNIALDLGDKISTSGLIGNIGTVYMYKKQYSRAKDCFQKKLKISEEIGDKKGVSLALGNLGNLYYFEKDYQKAMNFYEKQLELKKELHDKRGISIALGNIGLVFLDKGDYTQAADYFLKQIELKEDLQDKEGLAIAYGNLGNAKQYLKSYKEAMKLYDKAIELDKEIDLKPNLMSHLSTKAECLYKMGNYPEAVEINEQVIILAKELKNEDRIFNCKILSAKLKFQLTEQDSEKIDKCIEPLEKMLKNTQDKQRLAMLHYEIYQLKEQLKTTKARNSDHNRAQAIKLYKEMYKKQKDIEFKNRFEELENI